MYYYARNFKASLVGKRVIRVACEKCGCEYYYELARSGSGTTSAPYGIGSDRAQERAREKAARALEWRLDHDAELVPCPKCHWINEELVDRYRRGRYRGWPKAAVIVGGVGIGFSLFIGWLLSGGPVPDPGASSGFMIVGSAVFLTLAALIFLSGILMRRRIKPNRDHPFPPTIPRGGPSALLMNPETGELEAAGGPVEIDDDAEVGWIEFQLGRSQLPSICCECLDDASPLTSYRQEVSAAELQIPVCVPCAGRRRWRTVRLGLLIVSVLVALGCMILFTMKADPLTVQISLVLMCGLIPLVVGLGVYRSTSPVRVKTLDASRGVVRLRFRNDDYARRILRQDPRARL